MGTQSSESRPGTRAAICLAAMECFARKGVQGTSVADIIARSGLSAGAIYHHFDSKHHVVVEVARMTVQNALAAVREYDPAGPVSPRVLFESAVAGLARSPQGSSLLLQLWAGAGLNPELRGLMESQMLELRRGITARLAIWRAQQGGAPDPLADDRITQLLVGLTVGFLTQHALLPSFDVDGYISYGGALLDAYRPAPSGDLS